MYKESVSIIESIRQKNGNRYIAFGNLKLKAQEWIAKLPRIKSFTQWFGKT